MNSTFCFLVEIARRQTEAEGGNMPIGQEDDCEYMI